MTLAEIIRDAISYLYGFFPIRIVREWEQGVRLFCGAVDPVALTSTNGIFGSGLHAFWPLVGDLIRYPANIDVVETSIQTVKLGDGTEVTFSLGLRFRVKDAPSFFAKIFDDASTVSETCRSAAGFVAQTSSSVLDFAERAPGEDGRIAREARKQMHGWGVDIIRVQLINLTTAQALRLIQDTPRQLSRQEIANQ